jgi:hypothetical protein
VAFKHIIDKYKSEIFRSYKLYNFDMDGIMTLTKMIKKLVFTVTIDICLLGLLVITAHADCGGLFASNIEKTIKVDSFHSLLIAGDAKIFIRQGESTALVIKAPKGVIEDLDISVRGDELSIKQDDCEREYSVMVTMKEIQSLLFSGSVDVKGETDLRGNKIAFKSSGSVRAKLTIQVNQLQFDASGSSTADLIIETEQLEIDISGSVDLVLSGTANEVSVDSSGSTEIDGFGLRTKKYTIRSAGSSDLKINAIESLDVRASGSSVIKYKGQPQISTSTSGGVVLKSVQ